MPKVAVLGAGSWGTALCVVLSENFRQIDLWVRSSELSLIISKTRENESYLPGVILPDNVDTTDDLAAAVAGKDVLVLAVPSHALRQIARNISPSLTPGTILVNCAKGFEEETFKRLSAVLAEELPLSPVAMLSGPNHAEEIGRRIPSATVISSEDLKVAESLQALFMTPFFRVYTNPDITGVELGGALKNVIALAAGISDGLGFGDNAKAALVTRGLTEIARLGVRMGADTLTFAGLSGIGDLMATCTSKHSRNRNLGYALGQGEKLPELLAGMRMVAEGVKATKAAWNLANVHAVKMPITEETYKVLFENKDPRAAVVSLMQRGGTYESEDIFICRKH